MSNSIVQTYYSSFLLGAVSYFAQWKGHWLATPFMILYGTSILHHAKFNEHFYGKRFIHLIDKVNGHFIFIVTLYMAITLQNPMLLPMFLYWSGVGYMIYVYYIGKQSHLPGDEWIPWHVSFHIVACLGTVCLLLHY